MTRLSSQPSVWVQRFDNEEQQMMREAFVSRATDILRSSHLYSQHGKEMLVGLEIELPIAQSFEAAPQHIRDACVEALPGKASVELGAHQLELINPSPVDVRGQGFAPLLKDFEVQMECVHQVLSQYQATAIVRLGSFPLTKISEMKATCGKPEYQCYRTTPLWHLKNQRPDAKKTIDACELIPCKSPYVVGLMNAVHVNVDALGFDDAIDKLNRSLMLSPLVSALSANAQFVECKNSGYADVRFLAWEISHDVRSHAEIEAGRLTRVGLPSCYYASMKDYFHRRLTYPFIVSGTEDEKKSSAIGPGCNWRDARLKFFPDKQKILVEFRPLSLQPSLEEDVAMTVFYLGRLFWSQTMNEALLPMSYLQANKRLACRYGMETRLYVQDSGCVEFLPAREVLAVEIQRAKAGFTRAWGVSPESCEPYWALLNERLARGSPSAIFAKKVDAFEREAGIGGYDEQVRRQAIIAAIESLELASTL